MMLKQRLSSAKKKKRPAPSEANVAASASAGVQSNKRRRTESRSRSHTASSSNSMASGSMRVAQSIENGLPAQRRKEKQQRLHTMAMGDIQVAEEHLKFGRTNDAQSTLDNMSPETAVVAKTCAQYWIQRVQVC